MKTISVIGSGYVGVTTAAIAANAGYKVYLIDINPDRIDVLKEGKSFFYEEGINPLIKKAVEAGTLVPTMDYDPGITESDIVFSCVGTPDNPDGSSNLNYIFSAAQTAGPLLKKGAVFVQKSTVPVGTGRKVIEVLPQHVRYVSNPEFLREGTAVGDTLFFDRIVAGGSDKQAISEVMDLYKAFEQQRDSLASMAGLEKLLDKAPDGQYISTTLESAELIKVTANAFLALKISFANNIAKLADEAGADVVGVMDGIGADRRIGRAFFNAGRGYGGGCFPKDVSGLISSAAEYGVDMPIMTAATDVNSSMPGYIVNKAQKLLGTLKDKKVAVLGLAFKAGTSDIRKSPGVKIANILDKAGAQVTTYDPHVNGEARQQLRDSIEIKKNTQEAVKNCSAVFVTTEWQEFLEIDMEQLSNTTSGGLLVDAINAFDKSIIKKAGLGYLGVGRP